MKTGRLKEKRCSAEFDYRVYLATVLRGDITLAILNVGSRYESDAGTEGLPRNSQYTQLLPIGQVVYVPRIHVDGVHQTRRVSCAQVPCKRFFGDVAR